jgi:hypothetical protein
LLLPLLVLAACAEAVGEPPAAPTAAATLSAGFPPGGLADTIRIDASERLPLHSAELVAPDGTAIPSGPVDVDDSPALAAGQASTNDPWRTGIVERIGGGTPALGSGLPPMALRSRVQVLTLVSSASIPLPDPPAYRRDWQRYRIRLGFGVPPGPFETREIAAPEPPPPAPAP